MHQISRLHAQASAAFLFFFVLHSCTSKLACLPHRRTSPTCMSFLSPQLPMQTSAGLCYLLSLQPLQAACTKLLPTDASYTSSPCKCQLAPFFPMHRVYLPIQPLHDPTQRASQLPRALYRQCQHLELPAPTLQPVIHPLSPLVAFV